MPVISTNTASNSALRYLNINSDEQTNALNQVASGSRITRASDDAAGLAVATKLQSDVAVLGQASTNASHAVSVLETADGGLSSISDVLERMKVLCAEAVSGAIGSDELSYISSEYNTLASEIDLIVQTTTFNGTELLDGNYSANFLIGTSSSDVIGVSINAVDATTLLTATGETTTSASDFTTMLDYVNSAIDTVASARADVGAQESQFNYHSTQITASEENLDAAQSAIADADVAEAQSDFSSAQVKTNAAIAALASANDMPQQLLSLLQ